MGINKELQAVLYTAVKLRTRLVKGELCHGSAFIYEYQAEDNTFPFLVTAKSIVETAVEGRMTLVQARGREPHPAKNYTLDIDNFGKLWFPHPDYNIDVAITPFVPFVRHVENTGTPIFFQSFTPDLLASDEEWSKLEIADAVYALGFPHGYGDEKHLVPVVKRALTVISPNLQYRNGPQTLLDMPNRAGWVGAPIVSIASDRAVLMGMYNRVPDLRSGDEQNSESLNDMGIMIRADAVVAAISTYLREKGFIN
jgi:hypothetical protein